MKHIFSRLSIALAGIAIISLYSCTGNGGGSSTEKGKDSATSNVSRGTIEYVKDARIPDFHKMDLGVYNIPTDFKVTDKDGDAMLGRVAKIAGITPQMVRNKEGGNPNQIWYTVSGDPSAINNFDLKNGDLTFNAGMRKYTDTGTTPNLVKGDAATKRAQDYLRQLDIKAGDKEMKVLHTGGVNLGVNNNNTSKIYEKFTTVQFGRQLDGIDVFGHSRLVITMAEGGRLNTLIKQWAPLNKTKVTPEQLLTQDDAKAMLERSVMSENRDVAKISIESIQLVYFDDGSGVLEPALHVQGKTAYTSQDPKAKEFTYDTVIPVLKSTRMTYPYDHSKLAKRANEKDAVETNPGKRSPDDANKR